MLVTLKILVDVISKPDKYGKTKILKKDQEYLKQFETSRILVEQLISDRGIVSKKHCLVKDDQSYYKANHKFEELQKLTKPIEIKGFR